MACLCVWQYSAATVAFPSSIDASSSILTNYLNDTSHVSGEDVGVYVDSCVLIWLIVQADVCVGVCMYLCIYM